MSEEAAAPQFAIYVSSVKGRLVSRWDAPSSCFGARITTADERAAGADPIIWDEECVVPLLASFVARYDRELRNAFRNGDLLKRTAGDHAAWLRLEEQRESERMATTEQPAPAPTETPPPEEASNKPKKAKQ